MRQETPEQTWKRIHGYAEQLAAQLIDELLADYPELVPYVAISYEVCLPTHPRITMHASTVVSTWKEVRGA